MDHAKGQLRAVFSALNDSVETINKDRHRDGLRTVSRAEARILGQMSLLTNERASLALSLAQTGDVDALLTMDHVVKEELKRILKQRGLIYDEDSPMIWIPEGSRFSLLFEFDHILVQVIDPESALVSKAVKAPAKNLQLIRQAIASGEFPGLVDRILKSGGRLEEFVDD